MLAVVGVISEAETALITGPAGGGGIPDPLQGDSHCLYLRQGDLWPPRRQSGVSPAARQLVAADGRDIVVERQRSCKPEQKL